MGEVFAGRYELVDPIGRGGVGAVWRAWDHRRRRYVAAKVLLQSDAHSLLRFVREQALRIDHPHVVAPTSWAADDDKVLFTMDLVAGGSLVHLVGDYGPLPPAFVCTLLDQLLAGLAAVHAEGVVHRDVKPANVLLEATGTARPRLRLSDFGIAMRLGEPRLTETNLVVGTPGYLAPEQLMGSEPDFPADLFAVGLVALYLLEGAKPDSKALVQYFTEHGTPGAPKGMPEPLWQVVATLLQPDPEARFRTATGARKALAAAAELLPAPGPDDELIEIFDQLGPLPQGFAPEGPLRRAKGLGPAQDPPGRPQTGDGPGRGPEQGPGTGTDGGNGTGDGTGPGDGAGTGGGAPGSLTGSGMTDSERAGPVTDSSAAQGNPRSQDDLAAGHPSHRPPVPATTDEPPRANEPAHPSARPTAAPINSSSTSWPAPAAAQEPSTSDPRGAGPRVAGPRGAAALPPQPPSMSDTGSSPLPPPRATDTSSPTPLPPAEALPPQHPVSPYDPTHPLPPAQPAPSTYTAQPLPPAQHYRVDTVTASYTAHSPQSAPSGQQPARHRARRPARPGPPAKAVVPLLVLALACYVVGFWALAKI
ncbi:protein kinase [Streptomyces sp. NPDC017943]|uniref:serine/threonine-protein kinase n=1 Tax=Streptomyces sp. NPDC017943 TaxID=3365019 RepID=UPI0037AD25A4